MINEKCCDFVLFQPIHELKTSSLGLYNDSRFPGRCILKLNKHYDHLDEIPDPELYDFMVDVKKCVKVMKHVLQVDRVNFAILGNTVSHVHAHLIPRYPDAEKFPDKSPWNDDRVNETLTEQQLTVLCKNLLNGFTNF